MNGDQKIISLACKNLVENARKIQSTWRQDSRGAGKRGHVVQICVAATTVREFHRNAHPNVFEQYYRARGDEQETAGRGRLSIARELASQLLGGDLR